MPVRKPMLKGVHHLVRKLYKEIYLQQLSISQVAKRAGVAQSSISRWKLGKRNPELYQLEACLNAVGLDLVVRRRTEDIL